MRPCVLIGHGMRRPESKSRRAAILSPLPAERLAAVGGSSTLAGWFPFLRFTSADMLKQAGEVLRDPIKMKIQDSYLCDRSGRFRRMDRSLSAASRRASDAAGCLGSGQLSRFFRRRDPRDPRNLRAEPALYEDGGGRHCNCGRSMRSAGIVKLLHQTRRALDGTAGTISSNADLCRCCARLASPIKNCPRRKSKALAADQSGRRALGNLRAREWISDGAIACQAVLEGFLAEGGEYRQAAVVSRDLDRGQWEA